MLELFNKICPQCGTPFQNRFDPSKYTRGKYCSKLCSDLAQTEYRRSPVPCMGCGVEVIPNKTQAGALATGRQKGIYCSKECYVDHLKTKRNGEQNPNWKGGVIESWGYRYERDESPAPAKYEAEHRLVAEAAIGRKLLPGEVVHHRNGKRQDNRPDNLMVMTISEHMKLHARMRREKRGAV